MYKAKTPILALILSGLVCIHANAADADKIQQLLAAATPAMTHEALERIPDVGRKLLAARSYMRLQTNLESRWSWDEAQIAAFEGSVEQKTLLAEIALVAQHFSQTNPGFSLYENTQVRSLDKQIAAWNSNASVGASAASLLAAMDGANVEPTNLKAWLGAYSPNPKPNLAAPGLSAHGQMHAIDFQIMKDGVLIASADSTEVRNVWLTQGWAQKLSESVIASGATFQGPLISPDEPWHYSYYLPKP